MGAVRILLCLLQLECVSMVMRWDTANDGDIRDERSEVSGQSRAAIAYGTIGRFVGWLQMALRRSMQRRPSAELLWADGATLTDMKLPFEVANAVRREQPLCRPLSLRDARDR